MLRHPRILRFEMKRVPNRILFIVDYKVRESQMLQSGGPINNRLNCHEILKTLVMSEDFAAPLASSCRQSSTK